MNQGMRDYIEHLERDMPSHVIRVKKEVSPEFEIPAILQQVESRKKQPVLIFEKVRNLNGKISELPVVINLFGSRERLADAIGSTVQNLPMDYIDKERPIPPVMIDKSQAAVKQVIQKGKDVDLYELPIVTHHEMDLGPYLPARASGSKTPRQDGSTVHIIRIYVSGPRAWSSISTPPVIPTISFRNTRPSNATFPSL